MLFNSFVFIFAFLPATLTVFFGLARWVGHRAALGFLVAASLFFYGWWNPLYLWLIAVSIGINFAVGRTLVSKHGLSPKTRQALLILGVSFNLGLLGYYKYANFVAFTVEQLFSYNFNLEQILLPLAISFFTFQQVAYVVDAYRGKTAVYAFLDYCFLVTFFPHLIAGPIVQHGDLLSQIKSDVFRPSSRNLSIGVTLFVIGLFKKVVIADRLAPFVWPVYQPKLSHLDATVFDAWTATIAYSLQLYFDFSGYSDMAIGIARMFNFKFPQNFNSPYKAQNIIDFWRRCHMTLSRFLREYLYFSLGGNRGGSFQRYANLLITMVLGGLWHGAGWGFVIWGGLNGMYLVINHGWHKLRGISEKVPARDGFFVTELSILFTFVCVMLSRVFFRSPDFSTATSILNKLFGGASLGISEGLATHGTVWVAFLGLWLFVRCLPNSQELLADYAPVTTPVENATKLKWKPDLRWAAVTGILAFFSLLWLTQVSEFLYFQF